MFLGNQKSRVQGARKPARRTARFLALPIVLILYTATASCGQNHNTERADWSGDATRGAQVIQSAGCGQCHVIPGIEDAVGQVGPPLTHFGLRTAIAGLLPNERTALVRWLRYPQAVLPGNAMPNTGLTEKQASDAAAYLHHLR